MSSLAVRASVLHIDAASHSWSNNRFRWIGRAWRAFAVALVLVAISDQSGSANPYAAHYYDAAGVWRSNCTWWAWQRWHDVHGEALPSWGNAGAWAANAQAAGYRVDTTPAPGSIAVTWESPLGHVAFVEAVDPADSARFLVSEYGYATGIDRHQRWMTTDGSLLFIHPRADSVEGGGETARDGSTQENGSEGGDGTGGP